MESQAPAQDVPQTEDVADIEKMYQWPEKAGLRGRRETLIMAAQEQTLDTRSIEAEVYLTRKSRRCRLSYDAPETMLHLIAGCTMKAALAFLEPSAITK